MKLHADGFPNESHNSRASLAFSTLANTRTVTQRATCKRRRQLDLMNRYQRTFDRESYHALAAPQRLKAKKNAGTTRSPEYAENKPLSENG